jgi:hypothetical protein
MAHIHVAAAAAAAAAGEVRWNWLEHPLRASCDEADSSPPQNVSSQLRISGSPQTEGIRPAGNRLAARRR